MIVLFRKGDYGKGVRNKTFTVHALPTCRLRLAYLETTPCLHATFMVNFFSPGNNSLHPSVFIH